MHFGDSAWDLYFVYEANFTREVKHIVTDGLGHGTLELKPIGVPLPLAPLSWGLDGAYAVFVRFAAIVFITVKAVRGAPRLPTWLVKDLSNIQATYTFRKDPADRALSGLKATFLASKQNRSADPLMIDHMLSKLGVDSEASATHFVDRYNARVGFDVGLMLKDQAARRQANLLDPQKCTASMKQLMRDMSDKSDSLEETGFTMALPEFRVGHIWVQTSQSQWVNMCTTTPDSCQAALGLQFSEKAAGKKCTSSAYRDRARRLCFYSHICTGIFSRKGVSQAIKDRYQAMVVDGTYDEDIDGLISACDEDVGLGPDDMDKYLLEVCALVQDACESHDAAGANQDTEANARLEAAVGMDEAEWWLAECDHDVQLFRKARAERAKKAAGLKAKEDEYKAIVDKNVAEATTHFMSKHLPLVAADTRADAFWSTFKREVNERVSALARDFNCDVKSVLRVVFVDMRGP